MNVCKALAHRSAYTSQTELGERGSAEGDVCALLPTYCMMWSRPSYLCSASHLVVPFQLSTGCCREWHWELISYSPASRQRVRSRWGVEPKLREASFVHLNNVHLYENTGSLPASFDVCAEKRWLLTASDKTPLTEMEWGEGGWRAGNIAGVVTSPSEELNLNSGSKRCITPRWDV